MTSNRETATPAPLLIPGAHAGESVGIRRGLLIVLLLFAATRIVAWTGAYTGALLHFRIALDVPPPFEQQLGPATQRNLIAKLQDPGSAEALWFAEHMTGFAPLCYWDGGWFQQIIASGYDYAPAAAGQQYNIAYFPLYPLICRVIAEACSGFKSDLSASVQLPLIRGVMIAVSHVAGLAAALLMYLWIRGHCGHRPAVYATAALLCMPTACYLSFGYSESLAILLTLGAAMAVTSRRFLLAALMVALATATRPTAAALVPILMLATAVCDTLPLRRRALLVLICGAVASCGLACFAAYLGYRFGSPLVYFENYRVGWGASRSDLSLLDLLLLKPLLPSIRHLIGALAGPPLSLVDLIAPRSWNIPLVGLLLFVAVAGWRRVGPTFRPLLLIGPLVFLQAYASGGDVGSSVAALARYLLLGVPAIALLGVWMAREWPTWLRHATLCFFLALQGSWAFHFGLMEWHG